LRIITSKNHMTGDMDVARWIDLHYALKQCLKLAQDILSIQQRNLILLSHQKQIDQTI